MAPDDKRPGQATGDLEAIEALAQARQKILGEMRKVIVGQDQVIDELMMAILADGHCLLIGVPGLAKTLMVSTLAGIIDLAFKRIQFTPDLMPSDITGTDIIEEDPASHLRSFKFIRGPVFANVVLADEINRTNPRTQSALLEAMNERQVTVDGNTYSLGEPFIVIATQNPHDFYGTYPLPESQLDRFLLRIQLGYPELDIEKEVVCTGGTDYLLEEISPVVTPEDVVRLADMVERVKVEAVLLDYLMEIVSESRKERTLTLGISPRGAIHLFRASQAVALMEGRNYAIPDDLQSVLVPVLSHRIIPSGSYTSAPAERRRMAEQVMKEILDRIPVPV
jgi:MoxR-like ATPase